MRFQNVEQVLAAVKRHFLPEKAGNTEAIIHLKISGEGGGDWTIHIGDGVLQTEPGVPPHADLVFESTQPVFLTLANGELDPFKAYFSGQVRFQGSLRLVYRLSELFNLPRRD